MRSSLVLPQTPCSSFPDLMSYFFLWLQNFFFCLQQKPTSYALFLHKLLTSSQTPSTSFMRLFVHWIATCRTRVTPHFQRISPEMARHLWLQISYNQSPFFKGYPQVFRTGKFVSHIQGEVFLPALCYTVSIHSSLQTACGFTSVCWASYRRVKYEIFNISVWTHFEKTWTVVFKYFIITIFVTTSCYGLKVEKNRIVLRTRSAYFCFVCLTLLPNRYFPLFGLQGNSLLSTIFTASDNQKLCGLEMKPLLVANYICNLERHC